MIHELQMNAKVRRVDQMICKIKKVAKKAKILDQFLIQN